MHHEKISILDIPISNITRPDFLNEIYAALEQKQKNIFIVTANPEIIMNAKKLPEYKESILQADYIVPDGSGVMLASNILNQPLKEKITGYDLLLTFLEYSSKENKSVYFFGAKDGIAAAAAEKALQRYPNLSIAGTKHGYSGLGQNIAEEIAATEPDFVFVGLGAPLQEKWIVDYRRLFPSSVLMGVGGSFDVLSETTKRAPKFWLDRNLEWLYRLITQPYRAIRMIKLPLFLAEVYRQKRKNKAKQS